MRVHLSNGLHSALEYMVQPAVLLLATPILLHHLGLAVYGLWLIASAVAGTGGVVSSGFGDAIVQRVASLAALGDLDGVRRVVRTMVAINLALGFTLAAALWLLAPMASARIVQHDESLYLACLWSLRIASPLIVIKAIESVFISAQKAYQRYGPAVRIALLTRLLTLSACLGLAVANHGIVAMMLGTMLVSLVGATGQWIVVRRYLGLSQRRVGFDRATTRQLLSFGSFTWVQAISGVVFSQADRLLLGATLGPVAVACYGICVQLAIPIHGLTAAALHALFPYLASQGAVTQTAALRRPVLIALVANFVMAAALTASVIVIGPILLVRWFGPVIAFQSAGLLPLIALGFGMLALNVTGHYTLMALGRVRIVTAVNLAGGILMLLIMAALEPSHGVTGAALARLGYGPITCLLYVPLHSMLRDRSYAAPQFGQPEVEQV